MTPDSQRAELSLREGRRAQITTERLSRCVVEGKSSSAKAEVRKMGRTVYSWGADGHEERAPTALQTVLHSEGTGSVSGIDAATRCLEIS